MTTGSPTASMLEMASTVPYPKFPQTFSIFAKFPPEIRIKIWKFSLQRDRVVTVKINLYAAGSCTYIAALHTILHVDLEAREEVLRIFALHGSTYVNFETDILHFNDFDTILMFYGDRNEGSNKSILASTRRLIFLALDYQLPRRMAKIWPAAFFKELAIVHTYGVRSWINGKELAQNVVSEWEKETQGKREVMSGILARTSRAFLSRIPHISPF